jgi:hypothetical protein
VFLTFGILTVGYLQYRVYDRQAQLMAESLSQNERSIILGMGQLAVAARNAKTAEDTLAEMKSGSTDAHTLAESTKSAADTAKSTLHVSERAYLMLGPPTDDFPHKRTNIPLTNSGHIPSGFTKVVIHEATFSVDDPSAKIIPFAAVLEKHWKAITYQTIPVVPLGSLISVEVHLPALVQDDIANGKQGIIIAAVVTYNDGFPNTPEQTFVFCDSSSYAVSTKFFAMRPCDDPIPTLSALTALDKYPSSEFEEQK